MHAEVMDFLGRLRDRFPQYFHGKVVHEVGSLDLNGSVRPLFSDCRYYGFDLGAGKGVDIACNYADFPLPCHVEAGLTVPVPDVIISCEALEHDDSWEWTLVMMRARLCRKEESMTILTLASKEREEHGTKDHAPQSSPFTLGTYIKISVEEFLAALKPWESFSDWAIEHNKLHGDIYFWGVRE